jgi:hypothetical protein
MDREIRRRLKDAFQDSAPSPELDARILALMGFPPEVGNEPARTVQAPPRRSRPAPSVRFRLGRRFLLAAAVAAMVAFIHLSGKESSARTLRELMAAMARVRTARCSGWFVSYEALPGDISSPAGARMRVDWWYQAPDRFRREMGPVVPEWSFPPGTLVINGDDAVFYNSRDGSLAPPRKRQMRDLSPVDFFTSHGLLRRAAHEKQARIREEVRELGSEALEIVTVEYEQPGERVPLRFRWVLTVDPATDRLLHADWQMEARIRRRWRIQAAETLDRFEYDIPLPDDFFRFETAPRQRSSWGREQGRGSRPGSESTRLHAQRPVVPPAPGRYPGKETIKTGRLVPSQSEGSSNDGAVP